MALCLVVDFEVAFLAAIACCAVSPLLRWGTVRRLQTDPDGARFPRLAMLHIAAATHSSSIMSSSMLSLSSGLEHLCGLRPRLWGRGDEAHGAG